MQTLCLCVSRLSVRCKLQLQFTDAIHTVQSQCVWSSKHNPSWLGTAPATIVEPQAIGCRMFSDMPC